ncbi:MAG TPA: ABC transporter ATP-binding protein [Chloroflexota bacterium]
MGRVPRECTEVGASPSAIRTERLRRVFGDLVALDDVTLDVRPGELFGLLGPNGAGKTTLIRILTTLLLPTSGQALVDGIDVTRHPWEVRWRINLVSGDETAGYGLLTVRENLWLFSQLYGVPGRVAKQRIDALLDLVGLREKADARLYTLSSGMRQKMNIARGFVTNPRILFLDEPTLGLDVTSARDVRQYIRQWLETEPGRTVLLTTHLMHEAEELCHRVAIIHRGRILACDTPSSLKRRFQDASVFELEVQGAHGAPPRIPFLPGVRVVHAAHDDGRARLVVSLADDALVARLVQALTDDGQRLLGLRKREPTLEDVFLRLVESPPPM